MINGISNLTKNFLNSFEKKEELEPIKDAQSQPLDEQKIVNYVKAKIDQVRQTNSRIAIEGVYLTNVAYLLGYDGVYFDTTYRQFKNVDNKRRVSRSRYKINKILPTIQNRLARITQSPPKYDVKPESESSDDKDAARLGLDILNTILDKCHFEEKRQDLHMAGMQGGMAYLQVYWNTEAGKPMYDPESGEFQGYEGDVDVEVLNCLEIFSDPLAKSIDEAQWLIKAKVRKLDYFKQRYERGYAVKEEDAWLTSAFYDLKSNSMTNVGITGANVNDQMKNSAIELVYMEKRSKEFPKGRMIIMASGVLLEDKELPLGEFDIVKFDDVKVGSRYAGEAIITHLRPVQDQYNITRAKCADWVRKMLAGKYLAAKGAGLMQEAINSESGEVVEYNPVPNAGAPQPMNIPMIPSYVYEDINTLNDEFNNISGLGDVSQGMAPGSSMPWRAMALLQEQDQTRISVQTKANEIGYAKVGAAILKYVAKYYIMPRTMKIAGSGLDYAVKEFYGSQLNGNTDAYVIPGSTVPNSKVLNRQDILNTYQMGLLGDPADPKLRAKVLEMMEYGDVAEMWKSQALDMRIYRKTIEAIETGAEPPLNQWDNHELILKEMNDYRKTDKYDNMSDEQKKMFQFVLDWHTQAIVSLTQPQLGQQQMMAEQMVESGNEMFGGAGQGQAIPVPGMETPPPEDQQMEMM